MICVLQDMISSEDGFFYMIKNVHDGLILDVPIKPLDNPLFC